ncbi:hypothetical protein KAR91_73580, partial [Candidatus Pacearchaeota archaeon]|nr:hypothetical protein [Candidatus Pacearchaeota archaeon]
THRGSDGKNHSDVVLNNTHRGLTNNPHATDIENLGSGTLAELNAAITDTDVQDVIEVVLSANEATWLADTDNYGRLYQLES